MKKIITIVLVVVLALGVVACTSAPTPEPAATPTTPNVETPADETPAEKNITIGMANLALGDYFTGMRNAVVSAGEDRGWTVIATNADGDDAKLVADVENFVAQGVDGIIISGAWYNDIPAALDAAEAAGIPVVLVDRMFDSQNFTAWAGPDNEAMGEAIGKFITEQLPDGGTAVIIRGGPAENTIGINRTKGVTKALDAAGNFKIEVAPDFGNWSTDGGKTAMENMLAKHKKIDFVFCENDSMVFGAQSAAADAKRSDEMIFAGIDGANAAILAILEGGNYKATGYNDANVIGAKGVEVMALILAGKSYEKINIVDSPMITITNAEQYKNAGKWE